MRIGSFLLICSALTLTTFQVNPANTQIVEYDLPGLTGDYTLSSNGRTKTVRIVYEGPEARLERFQLYWSGYGNACYMEDPYTYEGWVDPLFVRLFICQTGQPGFFDDDILLIWTRPAHDIEFGPFWYRGYYAGGSYPGAIGWDEEVFLSPGDSLSIMINIYDGLIGGLIWDRGFLTLYDVVFWLDMNETVPVQQTTWGRIKAIYENSP